MASFTNLLKSVFHKLYFWKEGFSDKAWAVEKMRDVFIKEMNTDLTHIELDDFVEFVQTFYNDDGNLLQYPEFVMNAVSKMMTEIILSSVDVHEKDLNVMIKLLRSAISQGQLDKGQRVCTIFECMHKLLVNEKAIDHLMSYQFDSAFALLFAVGGTHNYARKAAAEYLVELVKFAFYDQINSTSDEVAMKKVRKSLRVNLITLFGTFNKSLMLSVETSNSTSSLDIVANYCKILVLCAESSCEWGNALAFTGSADEYVFNVWCDLLRHLSVGRYYDIDDVAFSSIDQLAVLANQRRNTKYGVTAFEMLSSLLVTDMSSPDSRISISNAVGMAHSIVSRCECSIHSLDTRNVLVDLSILPLLVVLDVDYSSRFASHHSNVRHLIEAAKEEVEKESKMKRSSTLISRALNNAFSLVESDELLDASSFASVIKYVTFKAVDPPASISRPFLAQGTVSNRKTLTCLVCALKIFKNFLEDPTNELEVYEAENIQTCIAPVLSFPGIFHSELAVTLDCYRALLCRLHTSTNTLARRDCFLSVMESIEIHLVNVDPNVRDVAVKQLAQLYLLEIGTDLKDALIASKTLLPSVWKCVRDKEENVVIQVFEFILKVMESRKMEGLGEVLRHMDITQEDLVMELQKCLLSSQWDIVKPVAFSLYSSFASSDVIRYAEVCILQSSSLAAPTVFRVINGLFKRWIDNINGEGGLKTAVDGLCNLLMEGWGDLVLAVLNGDNTTCLRHAVDVLVSLDTFLNQEDVADFIKRQETDAVVSRAGDCVSVEGLGNLKKEVKQYSKKILEGSFFMELCCGDNEDLVKEEVNEENSREVQKGFDSVVDLNKQTIDGAEYFDHKTERQPFILNKQRFPLPEMFSRNLVNSDSLPTESQASLQLFTLVGFKQLLNRLPLERMREEVFRSTDEYDRNSETILHDINNLLDKTLKAHSRKMEKEVTEIFLTELLEILEHLIVVSKEDGSLKTIQSSLYLLKLKIRKFALSKESFFEFALSKRKTVLFGEVDCVKLEFSPDFFDKGVVVLTDRFRGEISTKSYFPSQHGMKELLDLYVPCDVDSNDTDSYCHEYLGADDSANGSKLETNFGKAGSELQIFDSDEDFQNAVEGVKKSWETSGEIESCSLLDLLNKVIETCIGSTATEGSHFLPLVTVMSDVLGQLKEKYCQEDEDGFVRDGDNDPTAIDCY